MDIIKRMEKFIVENTRPDYDFGRREVPVKFYIGHWCVLSHPYKFGDDDSYNQMTSKLYDLCSEMMMVTYNVSIKYDKTVLEAYNTDYVPVYSQFVKLLSLLRNEYIFEKAVNIDDVRNSYRVYIDNDMVSEFSIPNDMGLDVESLTESLEDTFESKYRGRVIVVPRRIVVRDSYGRYGVLWCSDMESFVDAVLEIILRIDSGETSTYMSKYGSRYKGQFEEFLNAEQLYFNVSNYIRG